MAAQQEYTREEVARHNTDKSLWIIVDSEVFDLTKFVDMHPGGAGVILEVAGKDATGMYSLPYSLPGRLFAFSVAHSIHAHCFALRPKMLDVGHAKRLGPDLFRVSTIGCYIDHDLIFLPLCLQIVDDFYGMHRQDVLFKYRPRFKIGQIKGETTKIEQQTPGTISKVPYAEPSFWMNMKSPYYK